MANNHQFQSQYAVQAFGSTQRLWDVPIFESKSFVALPTVGALVAGWLLVVPRQPVLSLAMLSSALFVELQVFLNEIASTLEENYGDVAVFEHGPSVVTNAIGCGVDHAHIHLVPTSVDLLAGARNITNNIAWKKVDGLMDISRQNGYANGYWFLQQQYRSSQAYMGKCTDNQPISQLFRRVIANALNVPNDYDWKHSLGHDIIEETIAKLTGQVHSA